MLSSNTTDSIFCITERSVAYLETETEADREGEGDEDYGKTEEEERAAV